MVGDYGMMTEEEFWNGSAQRRYVHCYARHLRLSPDSLLGAMLARVATVTPPSVVAPAFTGADPSILALYTAIVGNSGDGKGLAERAARKLIPDLLGAVETLPVSGEGIVSLFAARRPVQDDDGGRYTHDTEPVCIGSRALLSVPEIGSLDAAMSRVGSSLEPVLLSAWSGEPLGGQNVDEAKRLRAPAYGYALNMITGVQPAKSWTLTDRDGAGLPQRFLWCDTKDLAAPSGKPPMPSGTFTFDVDRLKEYQPSAMTLNALYRAGARRLMTSPEDGSDPYPLHVLRYPPETYEAVDHDRLMTLHGQRPNGMDSHSLLLTIRVAGLLAILEQRDDLLTVTHDDWQAARWLISHSIEVRERCITESRNGSISKRADRIADDETARQLADEQTHDAKVQTCMQRIVSKLEHDDPNRTGVARRLIQQSLGGRLFREAFTDAINRLEADGIVEIRHGERNGERYALADGITGI